MKKSRLEHGKNLLTDRKRQAYCLSIALTAAVLFLVAVDVISMSEVIAQQTNTTETATTTASPVPAGSVEIESESASDSSLPATVSQPPLNRNFVWHGQISSSPSFLPDRNDTQTAVILIPRDDGGFYSGILTYQATRPVEPTVWHVVRLTNATAIIPEEFGETEGEILSLLDLNTNRTAQVVLSRIAGAETSGSIPFAGDAVELVGEDGNVDEPFIITYSLTGQASSPRIANNLESIRNFNATEEAE
jgi:hypothetical protein